MANWTLGLGGSDHDFSACLMFDHDIRVAIEEERLSRRKHSPCYWYESPVKKSIEYCLKAEGLSLHDIDCIVSSDSIPIRVIQQFQSVGLKEFPHHLCHAASAYLMLPFGSSAAILVCDGFGSVRGRVQGDPHRSFRETFSFYLFRPDGYECIGVTTGLGSVERDDHPIVVTNSLGLLYELVTSLLGYDLLDAGKVMGLSSHGNPRYVDFLEQHVTYGSSPMDCFGCDTSSFELREALEQVLSASNRSFTVRADLAASVQAVTNKAILNCVSLFGAPNFDYLCLTGGCALNSVANSFVVENSPFDVPVVIPPHSSDAGLAFGAMWLQQYAEHRKAPRFTFRGKSLSPNLSRPGRTYSPTECHDAIQTFYPRLSHDPSIKSSGALAKVIASGAIVGVMIGGSEFGPRALGGRSIVADPANVLTRERINRLVKKREPYRPLAPLVLHSRYEAYFSDERCSDAYMLRVARVKPRCLAEAPAVVHVDGTARVQVIGEDGDPFLKELLHAFEQLTGRAVLINTSFNRRGEPIVESPVDAVEAFLGLGLDGLYLNGDFYRAVACPDYA